MGEGEIGTVLREGMPVTLRPGDPQNAMAWRGDRTKNAARPVVAKGAEMAARRSAVAEESRVTRAADA